MPSPSMGQTYSECSGTMSRWDQSGPPPRSPLSLGPSPATPWSPVPVVGVLARGRPGDSSGVSPPETSVSLSPLKRSCPQGHEVSDSAWGVAARRRGGHGSAQGLEVEMAHGGLGLHQPLRPGQLPRPEGLPANFCSAPLWGTEANRDLVNHPGPVSPGEAGPAFPWK